MTREKLGEWRDTINRNFTDVFGELRYIVADEDNPDAYALTDESVTSSTTVQNDNELFVPVKANAHYEIRMHLAVQQAGAGVGLAFDWSVPSGSVVVATLSFPNSTVVTVRDTGATIGGGAIAGGSTSEESMAIIGRLDTGTTKGVLQFRFAQQSSSGSAITRKAGSWLRLARLDK